MGKTTVVEAFRAEVATDPAVWLAAGQCVEYSHPYLRTLERQSLCESHRQRSWLTTLDLP